MTIESINNQIKALETEKSFLNGRRFNRAWADPEKRATRLAEIEAEINELRDQRAELVGRSVTRAMRF